MSKLDRGDYAFEVKDGAVIKEGDPHINDEEAWIYCQPRDSELSIVGRGYLSIHLKPGTPHATVKAFAKTLRDLGVSIHYTPGK